MDSTHYNARMSSYTIVLIAFAAFISPAIAGGISDDDPRVITKLWRTSTSNCIGDVSEPVCAVETAMACLLWRDEKLCSQVGYSVPTWPDTDGALIAQEYHVTDLRTVNLQDIPVDWEGADWIEPGDVDMRLIIHSVYPEGDRLSRFEEVFYTSVREKNGVWRPVYFYLDGAVPPWGGG